MQLDRPTMFHNPTRKPARYAVVIASETHAETMTTSHLVRCDACTRSTTRQIDALADVLIDCVDGGASVSFMHPLTRERATAFWRRVADGVAAGERALLVAEDAHGMCGTVQLVLDQPENQPHRADLAKMLVHRRARRQGLAAALHARRRGDGARVRQDAAGARRRYRRRCRAVVCAIWLDARRGDSSVCVDADRGVLRHDLLLSGFTAADLTATPRTA